MSQAFVDIEAELPAVVSFLQDLGNSPWWFVPVHEAKPSPDHDDRHDIYDKRTDRIGTAWWDPSAIGEQARLNAEVNAQVADCFDRITTVSFKQSPGASPKVRISSTSDIPAVDQDGKRLGRLQRWSHRRSSRKWWQKRLDELQYTFARGLHKHPAATRASPRQTWPEGKG